jgi:hypothetical protein
LKKKERKKERKKKEYKIEALLCQSLTVAFADDETTNESKPDPVLPRRSQLVVQVNNTHSKRTGQNLFYLVKDDTQADE